jgi:hypothetical protein
MKSLNVIRESWTRLVLFAVICFVSSDVFLASTAVAAPRGDQECFSRPGYAPKVVFENIESGHLIWIGREGDLSEPYEYQRVSVESRQQVGCDVCFILKSGYTSPLDNEIYDVKIVTTKSGESRDFMAKVYLRKKGSGADWSYWYNDLDCRASN